MTFLAFLAKSRREFEAAIKGNIVQAESQSEAGLRAVGLTNEVKKDLLTKYYIKYITIQNLK